MSGLKVSLCSAFNIERDGISDYSAYLGKELSNLADVRRVSLEQYRADDGFYRQKADEANNADIVHIQFNYPYFNGELPYRNKLLFFLRHIRKPVVLTMHEVRIGYQPIKSDITTAIRRWLFNNTLFFWNCWSYSYHRDIVKKVNKIIAHTQAQYAMITSLTKDKAKVAIIPHAIPIIEPRKREIPSLEAKKRLGLSGKRVLGIVGFVNKKKGYELAFECLKGLAEDVVLLVAGGPMTDNLTDRQYYLRLEEKIALAGLNERVKITGYLSAQDIPDVMAAADICLAPFSSSSASGALSLCIAYNKPIIASDIEGHQEINSRFQCLELFRQGESGDLSEKIKRFLANPERMSVFSAAARAYSDEFSYAKIAKKTVLLYEDILCFSLKNSAGG